MYVSCQISDGLGNRLFQIAAMLGYAEKYGHQPVFIKEWIKWNDTQPGGNEVCSLFPAIPTMSLDSVDGDWSLIKMPFAAAMKYIPLPAANTHVKLDGYFQSPLYFPTTIQTAARGTELGAPALFLHVRRGDYLHPLNAHHYVDLTDYYQRALDLFPSDAPIYVCSDDIAWCKAVMPGRYSSVTADRWRWLDCDEFATLSVMMGCTLGGICANSTFSWWGAWLNSSPDKLVVMPATWMHPRHGGPLPVDLYPEGVLRI